jgi:hypothetical protein
MVYRGGVTFIKAETQSLAVSRERNSTNIHQEAALRPWIDEKIKLPKEGIYEI